MTYIIIVTVLILINSYGNVQRYRYSSEEREILHEAMDNYRKVVHDHPEEFIGTLNEVAEYEDQVTKLYNKVKHQSKRP